MSKLTPKLELPTLDSMHIKSIQHLMRLTRQLHSLTVKILAGRQILANSKRIIQIMEIIVQLLKKTSAPRLWLNSKLILILMRTIKLKISVKLVERTLKKP